MAIVVVILGPKAAGKSQVAEALHDLYGVLPVDADEIVLDLDSDGARPDPVLGWLVPIERAVMAALRRSPVVSVEATGAWDSDWRLPSDLEAAGAHVLRVWVCAPLEVTLGRLARRTARKAPTTPEEARSVYRCACARARQATFDLTVDTERVQPGDLAGALAPLAPSLRRSPGLLRDGLE